MDNDKNSEIDELEAINKSKTLTNVQHYMLDMLRNLISFLEQNNLKYYAIGGTLLGAIRHKGFIPWDDDIDIAMPRDDYDKFLKIFSDSLPDQFKLRTYDDESYHHYYFARVVDTRYKIRREGSLKSREEELWIDIFPLDGLPNNFIKRSWHKIKLLYLKLLYHLSTFDMVNLKRPNRPLYQRLIINLYMKFPFKVKKNYVDILNKIDKLLKKVSIDDSDYYMEFMGSSIPFKETLKKEKYGNGKYYDFEDLKILGPDDACYYLLHVYGDYMKLPPEEKRNCHVATFIKNK